jgi:CHAT domain-containing protein
VDTTKTGVELYRLIFEPIKAELERQHIKSLAIVPYGVLRYIPYSAIYDGGKYLIENFVISVRPPLDDQHVNDKNDSSGPNRIIAFGVTKAFDGLPELSTVRDEINGIVINGSKGLIPGKAILDDGFTENALLSSAGGKYQLMHIASHFVFSPGTESNSYLILCDGSKLYLDEIRKKPFNFNGVSLLTLSACSTAMGGGVDADGREIDGFAAIANRKGAKSIMASLWPVADHSTSILMKRFYANISTSKLGKAESLRQAQLDLLYGRASLYENIFPSQSIPIKKTFEALTLKPHSHPFYWAPFILMAN